MTVRLETSDAFILLIRNKDFKLAETIDRCTQAEEHHLPMYLIAPGGTNITMLLNFPWRQNGIYTFNHESDLLRIYMKIKSDLRFIRQIGV